MVDPRVKMRYTLVGEVVAADRPAGRDRTRVAWRRGMADRKQV
jgi:hypothetical protein